MTNTSSDIQQYVEQKLASGEYRTAEEFAAEAIRVYRELESKHVDLAAEVQRRIEQADAGGLGPLDIETIKAELSSELNQDGSLK